MYEVKQIAAWINGSSKSEICPLALALYILAGRSIVEGSEIV